MLEDVKITSITNVMTRSSWFVTKSEYKINVGSNISATYKDTQAANDGSWETSEHKPVEVQQLSLPYVHCPIQLSSKVKVR